MRQLYLFSHQASKIYLTLASISPSDQVLLLLPKSMDTRYNYHQFRLVFHHSIIEHFALELLAEGYNVVVVKEQDIYSCLETYDAASHEVTFVSTIDTATSNELQSALEGLQITNASFIEDQFFYLSALELHQWFSEQKQWKMANFYIMMRKRFNILMENDKPHLGKYSFDGENRNRAPKGYVNNPIKPIPIDSITQQAIESIALQYPNHPNSDTPFFYAVTRTQALDAMKHFIDHHLATFGVVQDAMLQGNPFMSHALLSLYMNNGLLSPKEVVDHVIQAYENNAAPIEAVEGFIRQILGWREYIRGVYQEKMPEYKSINHLNNHEDLPEFFWTAQTPMNCLHQTIQETKTNAYNHHIQRLMILSNYANLIGVEPVQLSNWFNSMYIDSHDWVVTPNVHGMGLYADGGLMSTKPYISTGNYINKMSDYCSTCFYDPKVKEGPTACPFHSLYWSFIERHRESLSTNPRMSLMYRPTKKNPE
jgi:deoxyribodipyrimidine photolyase-related protein